jgi:hypothetical protein
MKLWYQYDKTSSGWITLPQLCFLLYELPDSMTYFMLKTENNSLNEATFERYYEKKKTSNQVYEEMYKGAGDIGEVFIEGNNYFIHFEKQISIKEADMLQILKQYQIDVYNECYVHYKDVCNAIIKTSFDQTNSYYKSFNARVNRKIEKKWSKVHQGTMTIKCPFKNGNKKQKSNA